MEAKQYDQQVPLFLIVSSFGVSITAAVFILPFAIYNLMQGAFTLAMFDLIATIICAYNAYLCYHKQYRLGLNCFAVAPILAIVGCMTVYQYGVTTSFWSYPAVLLFYFILPVVQARVINLLYLIAIAPIAYQTMEFSVFIRFYPILIGMSFFSYMAMREVHKQHSKLCDVSVKDPLTGLKNRFSMGDILSNAMSINKRHHTPMSLLLIDLDNFKNINDTFGHEVGDDVLKGVASVMRDNFRGTDNLFRLGGEEFLVLLHDSTASDAVTVAERFRASIESAGLLPHNRVTLSIGVSQLSDEIQWKDWMRECDDALYRAKRNGRNRVENADVISEMMGQKELMLEASAM